MAALFDIDKKAPGTFKTLNSDKNSDVNKTFLEMALTNWFRDGYAQGILEKQEYKDLNGTEKDRLLNNAEFRRWQKVKIKKAYVGKFILSIDPELFEYYRKPAAKVPTAPAVPEKTEGPRDAEGEEPRKKNKRETQAQATPKNDKVKVTRVPSTVNGKTRSGKFTVANYQIANIEAYIELAIHVLKTVDEKVKAYGMEFGAVISTGKSKPLSLKLQIQRLRAFQTGIRTVANQCLLKGNAIKGTDKLNFKFGPKYELLDFLIVPTDESKGLYYHPQSPMQPLRSGDVFDENAKPAAAIDYLSLASSPTAEQLKVLNRSDSLRRTHLFQNQTTNALIAQLKSLYVEYEQRWGVQGHALFATKDHVQMFINKYIYPKRTIVNFPIIGKGIEKFLLGDIRLLDDEFWKKTQKSRTQMAGDFRQNIRREINQQYEMIGDALGDGWVQGRFEQIDGLDDFYDQLLNYISIPDLIRLSAKCLIQALGLDELLETLC